MKLPAGHRIHFVGIGGIGMSGIAEVLLRSGYTLSGSDLKENAQTENLRKLGATIFIGHRVEQVKNAQMVVFSSAIKSDNPERVEAKRLHLPILGRAEMLAELMRKKRSIVVAGAHGKTTTSAMVATILMDAGFDPTAVIGGRLRSIRSNAKIGSDEWFVAESDESDGSFLKLLPTVAVITNVDREHLDHYGSMDVLEQAFVDFANRVPFDGCVIACLDDPKVAGLISRIERPLFTYGIAANADVTATDLSLGARESRFRVKGVEGMPEVRLPVSGRHNVLNALAAISVADFMEIPGERIARGLAAFAGIERRLEIKGEAAGVQVVDDYAHHPTEIRATLESLRLMGQGGAVRVLYQPHRFTRLRDLWDAFVSVFDAADQVVVLPVYAASEKPIPGVESERFAREIASRGKTEALFAESAQAGARALATRAHMGDLIVTMGAGDVTKAGALILDELRRGR